MYSRILVPIDGSPTAQRGLEEALALAKLHRSSIVLLHVMEAFPMVPDMTSAVAWEQLDAALKDQGKKLLEAAHRAATEAGVASESRLDNSLAGRVCDIIVEQARATRCELIVMGTHGRRGIAHAMIGSDAERVIRLSPVPVLLVRSAAA